MKKRPPHNGPGRRVPHGPDADLYQRWHWGTPATRVIDWRDPDYPQRLIEIGRLSELRIHRPGQRGVDTIKIRPNRLNANFAAFDPTHRCQRIYLCIAAQERRGAQRRFWNPRAPSYPLAQIAAMAGGQHAARDYPPNVRAQPVGVVTNIVYLTKKKPDAEEDGGKPGLYDHEMGEEGGRPPILAVDSTGRLWYCGGTYWCGIDGIQK